MIFSSINTTHFNRIFDRILRVLQFLQYFYYLVGLCLGSSETHFIASLAALVPTVDEYCPSICGSIIPRILPLFFWYDVTNSTSICSPGGSFLSIQRLPVKISKRTTPKAYMSLITKSPSKKPIAKKS